MRQIIRAFYKARFFPRQLFTQLTQINDELAQLKRQMHGIGRTAGDLTQQIGPIPGLLVGLESLCDEMTRSTVATQREIAEMRAQLTSIAGALRDESDRISRMGATIQLDQAAFPSWIWTPDDSERVRRALAFLTPCAVPGIAKARFGHDRDGGYVMLDDLAGIAAAFSIGICDDTSWDEQIAARGIEVFQLDPTVDGPPTQHPRFHFEKLRLADHDSSDQVSLDTLVRTRLPDRTGPIILKLDIEGAEWDAFRTVDENTLRRCRQIVCEFHDLDRLAEAEFGANARAVFEKLAATHFVLHVHGNNSGNFANVANVMVPQSLEVTFGLREAYATEASNEIFPTPLDRPNHPGRADLFLGRFQFSSAPASSSKSIRQLVSADTVQGSADTGSR